MGEYKEADLLEELEALWAMYRMFDPIGGLATAYPKAHILRAAREAANKPKLEEGEEFWMRAKYLGDGSAVVGGFQVQVTPSDIRTDPPQGGE